MDNREHAASLVTELKTRQNKKAGHPPYQPPDLLLGACIQELEQALSGNDQEKLDNAIYGAERALEG